MTDKSSLKGMIPGIARLLDVSPAALYERQRSLVRAGLLDVGEGRGPGSGVRATAPSVALLLISVLAAERLTEADTRAQAIAATKHKGGRCPLTHQLSFVDALTDLLVRRTSMAKVRQISVSRTSDCAEIQYREGTSEKNSTFEGSNTVEKGVRVFAVMPKAILSDIATDVQAILHDESDEQEAQGRGVKAAKGKEDSR